MIPVTILIPIYNNPESEIEKTIESAISQGTEAVWVFDDGSDAHVASALDRVSDGLIKRFRGKSNEGMGAVMNKMIKKVKTPYYLKLDCGDNYTHKKAVQHLYDGIENRDFCYGNLLLQEMLWKYKDYSNESVYSMAEEISIRKGSGIIPFDHGLHRTEFTLKNKNWYPEGIKVGLDTYRFLHALTKKVKIKYIDHNFYYYNRNDRSISLKKELRAIDLPKIVSYAEKILDKQKINH